MRLKDTLKELRIKNGYTQAELSSLLGVRQYNISDYEIGRIEPSIDILIKYANLFHVSIDYIVGRKTKEEKSRDYAALESDDPYLDAVKEAMKKMTSEQKKKLIDTVHFIKKTYL